MTLGMWIHRLRTRTSREFLLKLKRASHRAPPRLVSPSAKRVLVIAPHMDDEVGPCGGTLIILDRGGAELHVAHVSDSSAGFEGERGILLSRKRRQEAKSVREVIGFQSVSEFGFPDGRLNEHESQVDQRIGQVISKVQPDLILCPFPSDGHSDHMVCARCTARAATQLNWSGSIWAYEVWTALWPNVAVDITAVSEEKLKTIKLYESQMDDRDYAGAALGLNKWRGLQHGVNYAEAFYECDSQHFEKLAAMLDEF